MPESIKKEINMNLESFRKYCLTKPGVTEEMPFDQETLVYKVVGKMFALTNSIGDMRITLKCDPDKATELRASYPSVQPGYHMSKVHWNTIYIDGSIDNRDIYEWIDHSYDLIVDKFSGKEKAELSKFS
jgi:predicted DNA-binding protein (MmcQ/YjbR family)